MNDSNSTALRGALARAIKSHVDENRLNGVKAAALAGIANSRMSMILRGQVTKVSSDALVDILGAFGYALHTDGNGFELVPSESPTMKEGWAMDKAGELRANSPDEAKVFPEISSPVIADNETDFDPDFDRVVADE